MDLGSPGEVCLFVCLLNNIYIDCNKTKPLKAVNQSKQLYPGSKWVILRPTSGSGTTSIEPIITYI